MSIKENADRILYEFGLLNELKKYGTPHIVGSYSINAMAWNDLDIDVTNENMSTSKLYQLTSAILDVFSPTWYEAKQEINEKGEKVWFHGFETGILGDLWNVDIWFFNEKAIQEAENFADKIKKELELDDVKRNAIIQIKKDLIQRGMYSFEQYTSMDVYRAVLKDHITDIETFLQNSRQA